MKEHQTTVNSESTAFRTIPIAPLVLGRLLGKLGMPQPPGLLEETCLRAQPDNVELMPGDRISRILQALQKKSVQVAQLRWDRLDRRHLPVLVLYGGQWCCAEHGDGGDIILTGSDGREELVLTGDLGDAPVLWLRGIPIEAKARELLRSSASRLLLDEVLRDKKWVVEVLVATLVVNLLAVATSLYAMQIYDRVIPTLAYSTLTALSVGMAIIVLLDWALKFIRARILDGMAKQVDMAVSQRLFEHVLRLRLDTRPRSLGSLAAQMNGLETVRAFFSSTIVFTMTDIPFCFMFIGLIAVIGGSVSLVYIFLLPVALFFGWLAQGKLRELAHQEIQSGHERHGLLVDTIQGAETIQATGGGWRFADAWRSITATMAGYSLKSKLISSTTATTTGSLGTIAYVAAIVVGVTRIEAGDLTTGGLIACTILGGRVINPIAQSVQLLVQWQHVRESLTMVNRLLSLETDRREDQTLLVPDTLADTLDFEGIRFSYPNSPLQRLNLPDLKFAAGDRVVILGPNGSGKSTLLKVAAGLYKPNEGQVRLGGADVWQLDPQVVNERIGYLPQDVHLFKGSLRSNMALGGGVSDSKLLEVAQLLGIDRVAADNPRSMDLEISEGGQGLSGGQRQLVGLARVFLSQPRVWLLDEPSASLDMESENKVLEAINQWARSTDIVIIATHRPRLTSLANRVIVMRRGQVVADGKPDDVLPGRQRNQLRPAGSVAAIRT
ncbi:MAG: ATP-binding cassette domain-containing protein [Desulfuromonadales bacterium]|nr:ATP-binding cassette domain-containing protein [Desulfuromonadales bacterium]